MTKLPISIAITAAVLSTAACDRNKIQREAEDVREAREEVHEEQRAEEQEVSEAKAELQEEQAELTAEVQQQVNDLEERYQDIQEDSAPLLTRLKADGTHAQKVTQIEQAKELARKRIADVRTAKTAQDASQALVAAKEALDNFENVVDESDDNV